MALILLFSCHVFASVGSVSLLRGDADIFRDKQSLKAKNLMEILKQDEIQTAKKTKMQIRFRDDSIVTLGSSTTFKVDDYLLEEKDSKVELSIAKGAFKVITGKIGKLAPKRFKVKTLNAHIGIRGTIFVGEINLNNSQKDYITCLEGAIIVSANNGSKQVVLKPGQMVVIGASGNLHVKDVELELFSILFKQKEENVHVKHKYQEDKKLDIIHKKPKVYDEPKDKEYDKKIGAKKSVEPTHQEPKPKDKEPQVDPKPIKPKPNIDPKPVTPNPVTPQPPVSKKPKPVIPTPKPQPPIPQPPVVPPVNDIKDLQNANAVYTYEGSASGKKTDLAGANLSNISADASLKVDFGGNSGVELALDNINSTANAMPKRFHDNKLGKATIDANLKTIQASSLGSLSEKSSLSGTFSGKKAKDFKGKYHYDWKNPQKQNDGYNVDLDLNLQH